MKKILMSLLAIMLVADMMAENASDGLLSGKFSVSENLQVQFTCGNLQYHPYNATWRFAEQQYDFVGNSSSGNVIYAFDKCNNGKISPSYEGWIDLFGWGTGKEPWKATENSEEYESFFDWGNNLIINGVISAHYRTLTWEEWFYLFVNRPNAELLRGQATVNNVHGYILLPDNWVAPKKISFMANANNWETNTYSTNEWAKMETAGAVFLPAAGFRSGKETSVAGIMGFYWSSNLYEKFPQDAFDIFFSEKRIGPRDHEKRFYGLSVRLVQDIRK